MWFLLGKREDFVMFLMIGQLNGPLQPKKNRPIKTFVFQDSSQLIKLINMNHDKYLNSC